MQAGYKPGREQIESGSKANPKANPKAEIACASCRRRREQILCSVTSNSASAKRSALLFNSFWTVFVLGVGVQCWADLLAAYHGGLSAACAN